MYDGREQRLQARGRGILIMVSAMCALAVLVILINWIVDQVNLANNGEPDFTKLTQSEMKEGLFVTGRIDYALGPYANEYFVDEEGNEVNSNSEKYYYLVPVYSHNTGAIDCFVSFKADSGSDKDYMEKLAQSTSDGTYTAPLAIKHGRMVSLDSEQKDILKKWATDKDPSSGESFVDFCADNNILGTTDKDVILSKMMTYTIYRMDTAGINLTYILIPAIIGLIFFSPILANLIKKKIHKKKKDEMEEFDINQPM